MPAPFLPSLPLPRCSCRYPIQVAHSLMLDASAATAQYLTRTYATGATVTLFAAVKRGKLGAIQPILGNALYFDASDHLVAFGTTTAEFFRDPSAWYLIEAGPSGLRVNGVELATSLATAAVVNQPVGYNGSNRFDGYLAEIHVVDGLDVVGQFTAARGEAAVCAGYSGSHGAAGTHLAFSNAAALGADAAGVGNWTVNGAPVQCLDTPTHNCCVLSPLTPSMYSGMPMPTISRANLRHTAGGSSIGTQASHSPLALPAKGRWYVEMTVSSLGSHYTGLGVGRLNTYTLLTQYRSDDGVLPFVVGNTVGVLLDMDAGQLYPVGPTGTIGSGVAMDTSLPLHLGVYTNNMSGSSVVDINCGQFPFAHALPAGASPLASAYLPCGMEQLAGQYTGNGSADGPVVWTGCELESLTIGTTSYYNDGSARGTVDFLATGFKLRTTSAPNTSSTTYTWSGVRRVAVKCATAGVN